MWGAYRKGIAWTENMTPQRAAILAEVHDRREREKALLAQSSDTLGRKALGFGASLLAQLPDPINFVPVAGALGKGAGLGAKVLRGAREGAVSTALADAVIFPVANERGEDFGFYDAAMDIMFGALLGGGLGALGHGLSRWNEGRTDATRTGSVPEQAGLGPQGVGPAQAAFSERVDGFYDAMDEALAPAAFDATPDGFYGPAGDLEHRGAVADFDQGVDRFYDFAESEEQALRMAGLLEENGLPVEDAAFYARQILEADRAQRDGREFAWSLRENTGGEERAKAALLLDRAVLAVEKGESPDLGAWARELGIGHPLELTGRVLNVDRLVSEYRPLWARDMDFKEMLPLARRYWMEHYAPRMVNGKSVPHSVTTARGDVFFKGVKGWKKYYGNISPDKLRLLPFLDMIIKVARWENPAPSSHLYHQKQGVKIHKLQSFVQLDEKILDVRIVVREAKDGKFFYELNEWKVRNKNTPPESFGKTAVSKPMAGERAEVGAYLGTGTLFQRQTDQLSRFSTVTSEKNIAAAGDTVNLSVRDITPDMSRPAPLPEYRAPELPKNIQEELAAMGIDARTGESTHEFELARLVEEGRIAPEQLAELEAIKAEGERINQREDIALGLVGCITEALK